MSDLSIYKHHNSIPNKYNINYNNFLNETPKYIFTLELILYNEFNNVIIRKIEHTKYSHLIKLDNQIKLDNIKCYNVSLRIILNNIIYDFELEGNIIHNLTTSTNRDNNLYIEFTQNKNGYALCSCFYTGLDYGKLFVSPPN